MSRVLCVGVPQLYFSAHWCPPCRAFTPQLVDFYNNLKKTSTTPVEVVFVSCDRDERGFSEYFSHMPWLAVPFPASDDIGEAFDVSGIPTLVVLNVGDDVREATLITKDGRTKVARDPRGESFPWRR